MSLQYKIPAFDELSGDDRARAEQLLLTLDWQRPETIDRFGQEICDALGQTTQGILATIKSQPGSVHSSAMKKVVKTFNNLDLATLTNDAKKLASQGLTLASQNKGLAVAGVGAVLANPVIMAVGGFFGVKKWLENRNRDPHSMPAIEGKLMDALHKIEESIGDLQFAQQAMPAIAQNISELHTANAAAFHSSAFYLSVGRKYAQILTENIIPECQTIQNDDPSFKNQERLETAQASARALDRRLHLIETIRTGSVESSAMLRQLGEAMKIAHDEITSILTAEVPAFQRDIAIAMMAVDTHRQVRTAANFREQIERMRDDTITATQLTLKSALDGRLDNPERIKRSIDRLSALSKTFTQARDIIASADQASIELQRQAEEATQRLLGVIGDEISHRSVSSLGPAIKRIPGPGRHPEM